MSKRALAVHGVVAILALVAAFMAWRHARRSETAGDEPDAEAEVVAVDISPSSLKGITYRSKTTTVEVEVASAKAGKRPPSWITFTTETKAPPPEKAPRPATRDGGPAATRDGGPAATRDGGPAAAGDAAAGDGGPPAVTRPAPETKVTVQRFAANETLDGVLAKLAPFKVVRRLGVLGREELADFGLAEPEASLELDVVGGARRFEVGARTFGAGSYFYLREDRTGEVYLFGAQVLRDLELAPSRLMQRELTRFEPSDAARAVVTAGSRRRELAQRNRHNPLEAAWVDAAAPDAPSKAATSWMQEVGRLRALAYPGGDDDFSAEADTAAPVVRVEYSDEQGAALGFVEIARTPATPPEYMGRSDATGSWVRLSQTSAEQIAEGLAELLPE